MCIGYLKINKVITNQCCSCVSSFLPNDNESSNGTEVRITGNNTFVYMCTCRVYELGLRNLSITCWYTCCSSHRKVPAVVVAKCKVLSTFTLLNLMLRYFHPSKEKIEVT